MRRLSAGLEGVSKRIHYVSRGRGVMDAANNAALPSSPPGRGQGGEPRWLSRRARPDMAAGSASVEGCTCARGRQGKGKAAGLRPGGEVAPVLAAERSCRPNDPMR